MDLLILGDKSIVVWSLFHKRTAQWANVGCANSRDRICLTNFPWKVLRYNETIIRYFRVTSRLVKYHQVIIFPNIYGETKQFGSKNHFRLEDDPFIFGCPLPVFSESKATFVWSFVTRQLRRAAAILCWSQRERCIPWVMDNMASWALVVPRMEVVGFVEGMMMLRFDKYEYKWIW